MSPVRPICLCLLSTIIDESRWLVRVPCVLSGQELPGPDLLGGGHPANGTHSPTAPDQGLGRCYPQRPDRNQNTVAKKAGNFIELSFLFSREAEKPKEPGKGEEEAHGERSRERLSSGKCGAREHPVVSPFLQQGPISSLLWMLKTEGEDAEWI